MTTMSASEARAALPEILDRVIAGEEVTITRHGQPVAVVVRADTIRVRRADRALAEAEHLRDMLARARSTPLSDAPTMNKRRADELVAEVAAGRSAGKNLKNA
ncbi:MAG: type II toxin-antitoxin system Phd/YefM family antitoxin [Acidimicrobiia bacterium]